jgi:hypothetical protein
MAKSKLTEFTAQVKVIAVVDVTIRAANMTEAIQQANNLKLGDVFESQEGVSENESRVSIVGMFGGYWGMD